jgi:branched-chain amino acid aminotransferase
MSKSPIHSQHGTSGREIAYMDGQWFDEDPKAIRPNDHAFRMASVVFDGARAIAGKLPDLEAHCARSIKSARIMGFEPEITTEEIVAIAKEGVKKFPADAELYISPSFYGEEGFITPEPKSCKFVMSIFEAPVPEPTGFSACLTQFRRPARNMAPTEAKASCLYPNVARGVTEAREKGFDVGVVLDPNGNVAEFSYTNLFLVKDGVVSTPAINGTFLNGITRQRIIKLLRDAGLTLEERAVDYSDVKEADELFATGNYAKVSPCTQIEDRQLQPGPVFRQARELYFGFVEAD